MNDNPFSLIGKKILITGAASGIGKATSIILSKLGAALILVDINPKGLKETIEMCNTYDRMIVMNLMDTESIKDRIISVTNDFGKLNGFVHLAGKPYISPLKTIQREKCDEVYRLNTYVAIELSKIFISRNVFAGEKGSIVLVSSVYGIVGSAANAAYAMSKSALHGITKSLSMELAEKNIRINCVAPGFVRTKMMEENEGLFQSDYLKKVEALHPLGLGEAEDVGYSIAFLLSDAAKWITGCILNVDGGFTSQ